MWFNQPACYNPHRAKIMPLIRLTHNQLEAARRNGARSRGPKTPGDKDAFHDLLQFLIRRFQPVDEAELSLVRSLASIDWRLALVVAAGSRIPGSEIDVQTAALIAARESRLTFQRQAVLNQLRQLRRDYPLPAPPPQVVESEPVDPEIPAATEPELNPQPVDSMGPPPPAEPGKSPDTALPEAA